MSPRPPAPPSPPTRPGPSDHRTGGAGRPLEAAWNLEQWLLVGVGLLTVGIGILIAAHEGDLGTRTLLSAGGYGAAAAAGLFAVGRPRATDRVACLVLAVAAFLVATAVATLS